jgi:hypothetical protein
LRQAFWDLFERVAAHEQRAVSCFVKMKCAAFDEAKNLAGGCLNESGSFVWREHYCLGCAKLAPSRIVLSVFINRRALPGFDRNRGFVFHLFKSGLGWIAEFVKIGCRQKPRCRYLRLKRSE